MKRPFPVLSVLALICAALFYLVSAPVWHYVVWHRIESTYYNSEDAREDAGRFASLDVVSRSAVTAAFGALIGVVLSVFAHRRRESVPALRIFAAVANILFIGYALYFFLPLAT